MTEYQKKWLSAAIVAILALVTTFIAGPDEEKQRQAVAELCQAAELESFTVDGEDLCSHGPDPATLDEVTFEDVFKPVPSKRLCVGDGVSGARISIYADPSYPAKSARATVGYAQRLLQDSSETHRQRLRFLCENGRPKVTPHSVNWTAKSTHWNAWVKSIENPDPNILYLFIGNEATIPGYPYCGQGFVGATKYDFENNVRTTDYRERPGPTYSLVACDFASRTTLHEIGHNIGAVVHEAPHASGAWHCYDQSDMMCYNDGGSYFQNGGQMHILCEQRRRTSKEGTAMYSSLVDCNNDDYWSPGVEGNGPLQFNVAHSRWLTKPRVRG